MFFTYRDEGIGHAIVRDNSQFFLCQSSLSAQKNYYTRRRKWSKELIGVSLLLLQTYLSTLNMKDVWVSEVTNIIKTYQTIRESLDDELSLLRG